MKKFTIPNFFVLFLSLFILGFLSAQDSVIGKYEFTGGSTLPTYEADGVTFGSEFAIWNTQPTYPASIVFDEVNGYMNVRNTGKNVSQQRYGYFSITPDSGKTVQITKVEVLHKEGNTNTANTRCYLYDSIKDTPLILDNLIYQGSGGFAIPTDWTRNSFVPKTSGKVAFDVQRFMSLTVTQTALDSVNPAEWLVDELIFYGTVISKGDIVCTPSIDYGIVIPGMVLDRSVSLKVMGGTTQDVNIEMIDSTNTFKCLQTLVNAIDASAGTTFNVSYAPKITGKHTAQIKISYGDKVAYISLSGEALSQNSSLYVNDMDYVLGDVKQAFIQDKVNSESEIDNLLKGFRNLKVNGIRIPIIAEGFCPNKAMLKLFVKKATDQGFLIFANPAQSGGGKRLANGVLDKDDELQEPVLNNPIKTKALIDAVKAFAKEFPCKWICPFNEDAKPGNSWSVAQYNTVFSSLKDSLNGAELIGACSWGIETGINILKSTRITDYITISTTHNLGFENLQWPDFIRLSKAKNLPVWDSEVTNGAGDEHNKTRIVAAIDNKVNGLVLYNSWSGINTVDGTINSNWQNIREMYLSNTSAIHNVRETEIKIYPNPAIQNAPIMIRGLKQNDLITVYGLNGNKVYSATYTGDYHIIKEKILSAGIYLIKVGQKEINCVKKLIVN
jgi:hypothetical protein